LRLGRMCGLRADRSFETTLRLVIIMSAWPASSSRSRRSDIRERRVGKSSRRVDCRESLHQGVLPLEDLRHLNCAGRRDRPGHRPRTKPLACVPCHRPRAEGNTKCATTTPRSPSAFPLRVLRRVAFPADGVRKGGFGLVNAMPCSPPIVRLVRRDCGPRTLCLVASLSAGRRYWGAALLGRARIG